MKTEQPDKIFREKLANFEKAAPANAWDRIEAGLGSTKRPGVPYWRIAAAVLVMGLLTYALISSQTEAPALIAEAKKESTVDPTDIFMPVPNAADSGVVEKLDAEMPERTTAESNSEVKNLRPITQENISRSPKGTDASTGNSIAAREPYESTAPITVDISEGVENTDFESNARILSENNTRNAYADQPNYPSERQSITLVMTADDTKAYLKKNTEDGATQGSGKTSTLKRVLQKASELKSNDQDPFGDLRQIKNEILALNFKSEKQREQKQMNQ